MSLKKFKAICHVSYSILRKKITATNNYILILNLMNGRTEKLSSMIVLFQLTVADQRFKLKFISIQINLAPCYFYCSITKTFIRNWRSISSLCPS